MYSFQKNFLTEKECSETITWFENNGEYIDAEISNYANSAGGGVDTKQRSGKIIFMRNKTFPAQDKIIKRTEKYAKEKGIKLNAGEVDWQFAKYTTGDHFQMHRDMYPSYQTHVTTPICRKISLSVQLSDPETYEGGTFRMEITPGVVTHGPTELGSLLLFPSYYNHSISEITSGTRYSLIGWYRGPFWT